MGRGHGRQGSVRSCTPHRPGRPRGRAVASCSSGLISSRALGESLAAVRSSSRGRLVLVGGEAGVGKTALVRRFCDEHGGRRGSCGAPATRCSRRVRSGRCSTSPRSRAASSRSSSRAARSRTRSRRALMRELADAGADDRRARGPALGRRGDARRPAAARPQDRGGSGALSSPATATTSSTAPHPLRIVLGELATGRGGRPARARAALAGGGRAARRAARRRRRRALPQDRRNPFFVTEVLAAGEPRRSRTRSATRCSPALARLSAGGEDAARGGRGRAAAGRALAARGARRRARSTGSTSAWRPACSRPSRRAWRSGTSSRALAVEESLPPNRSVALHRRALAALADPPGGAPDLARLAHHAEAAGDAEAVLRFAPAAGGARGSLGRAPRGRRAVRAGAPVRATACRRRRGRSCSSARSHECYLTDQFDEAIDAPAARARVPPASSATGARRATSLRVALVAALVHRPDRGGGARPAGRRSRCSSGCRRARARAGLQHASRSCAWTPRTPRRAVAWGTRALELAERLDDTEVRRRTRSRIGARRVPERAPEGRREARAEPRARPARRGSTSRSARAYRQPRLGRASAQRDRTRSRDRYVEAGLEYCSERGLDLWRRLPARACARASELDRGALGRRPPRRRAVVLDEPRAVRARPPAVARGARARAGAARRPGRVGAARRGARRWPSRPASSSGSRRSPRREPRPPGSRASRDAVAEDDGGRARARAAARRRRGRSASSPAGAGAPASQEDDPARRRRAVRAPARRRLGARRASSGRELGCPYEAALALADADDDDALRRALDELQRLGARPAAAIVARRLRERGARGLPRGPRPATRENPAEPDRARARGARARRARACATPRSPSGSSSPRRRSTTTSRRSCASSASAPAARRAPRPCGSGSPPKIGSARAQSGQLLPMRDSGRARSFDRHKSSDDRVDTDR